MKSFSSRSGAAGFLAFALLSAAASAQTITENTPLSFGEIAIVSAGSVGRVTLSPAGTYTNNSNVYIIEPPQLGEYTVTGGPPNTAYTIMLPPSVTISGPGGPFVLDNLEVRPLSLVTDASGQDEFTISGRLQTQGGGTSYGDGNYSGSFIVTINF